MNMYNVYPGFEEEQKEQIEFLKKIKLENEINRKPFKYMNHGIKSYHTSNNSNKKVKY